LHWHAQTLLCTQTHHTFRMASYQWWGCWDSGTLPYLIAVPQSSIAHKFHVWSALWQQQQEFIYKTLSQLHSVDGESQLLQRALLSECSSDHWNLICFLLVISGTIKVQLCTRPLSLFFLFVQKAWGICSSGCTCWLLPTCLHIMFSIPLYLSCTTKHVTSIVADVSESASCCWDAGPMALMPGHEWQHIHVRVFISSQLQGLTHCILDNVGYKFSGFPICPCGCTLAPSLYLLFLNPAALMSLEYYFL